MNIINKLFLKRSLKKRHFSLIELLVVIAIIAILAGILFPVFQKARISSRRSECRNNLHNIGLAINSYLNDYKDILPEAAQMPTISPSLPRICDVLNPYIDNYKIFSCPEDRELFFENQGTSYEYNSMVSGRPVKDIIAHHLGNNTFIMFDFKPFHGKAGNPGACNYLFVDGRVDDLAE